MQTIRVNLDFRRYTRDIVWKHDPCEDITAADYILRQAGGERPSDIVDLFGIDVAWFRDKFVDVLAREIIEDAAEHEKTTHIIDGVAGVADVIRRAIESEKDRLSEEE